MSNLPRWGRRGRYWLEALALGMLYVPLVLLVPLDIIRRENEEEAASDLYQKALRRHAVDVHNATYSQ
ncbi:MAG: hypothetical protein GY822_09895 [Deltaproteobacteria bacterium]|nr:hypothetical protein [Deltaproteobacteria bacterium]